MSLFASITVLAPEAYIYFDTSTPVATLFEPEILLTGELEVKEYFLLDEELLP